MASGASRSAEQRDSSDAICSGLLVTLHIRFLHIPSVRNWLTERSGSGWRGRLLLPAVVVVGIIGHPSVCVFSPPGNWRDRPVHDPALVPARHTVSALVCSQLNTDMVRAQGAAAVQVSQFDRCGPAAAFAGYDAVATNVLLHRRQFHPNPREHIFEYPLSTLSRARSMSEPGTDSPRAVFPPRYRLRPLGSRRSRGLGTNTCLTTSSSPGSGFVTRR